MLRDVAMARFTTVLVGNEVFQRAATQNLGQFV